MSAPSTNGHPFTFEGREYFLPRVNQDDKKELHAIANAHALTMMRMAAKYQPDADAAQDALEVRRLVAIGYFWWDEAGGHGFRNTLGGLVRLVHLGLKRQHRPKKFGEAELSLDIVKGMADVDGGETLWSVFYSANPDLDPSGNPTRPPRSGGQPGGSATPPSPSSGEETGPPSDQ
jgi:hypothetical protein